MVACAFHHANPSRLIMCLFPKLIKNKKFLPTKKNNYNPPICEDERLLYVPVGCGNCIECRTQKAREWQVRLNEELASNKFAYFVTLTFSEESMEQFTKDLKDTDENYISTIAVRRFLERYRKKNKRSLKHWLITELGHNNTERLHLHGIIFNENELTNEDISYYWKYGFTFTGDYCTTKTVNYIIKYVTKIDNDHKGYTPKIFCTAGIGKTFITDKIKEIYKYDKNNIKEYYKLPNGQKINLPIYYRNKLFTEEEKQKLWQNRLDKHTIYVRGIEIPNIDTDKGMKQYFNILKEQQNINAELGYGNDTKDWKKQIYKYKLRDLNKKKYKKMKKNLHI